MSNTTTRYPINIAPPPCDQCTLFPGCYEKHPKFGIPDIEIACHSYYNYINSKKDEIKPRVPTRAIFVKCWPKEDDDSCVNY